MLGKITTLRGRVSEPRFHEAEGCPGFTLEGRAAWLEDHDDDTVADIGAGDEMIVAGYDRGGQMAVLALRNLTRHTTARARATGDGFWGAGLLVLGIAIVWLSVTASEEDAVLTWLARIGFGGLGAGLLLVSAIHGVSIVHKVKAGFLVDVAGLEIVRGPVGQIARFSWDDPARRPPRFTVAGLPVQFAVSRVLSVSEGDQVIVAGFRTADGFIAHVMRDLSLSNPARPALERGWNGWSRLETGLIALLGLGSPAGLFIATPSDIDPLIALRYLLIVAVWSATAVALTGRYYAWKLDREAARRVESG